MPKGRQWGSKNLIDRVEVRERGVRNSLWQIERERHVFGPRRALVLLGELKLKTPVGCVERFVHWEHVLKDMIELKRTEVDAIEA